MTKVTPGERAINWAKAAAIIVPLFGAGVFAGNTDIVHDWVRGGVVEADGQTEVTATGLTFEESVVKNSQEVRIELDEIQAQLKKLSAKSRVQDSGLQRQITKWHGHD